MVDDPPWEIEGIIAYMESLSACVAYVHETII